VPSHFPGRGRPVSLAGAQARAPAGDLLMAFWANSITCCSACARRRLRGRRAAGSLAATPASCAATALRRWLGYVQPAQQAGLCARFADTSAARAICLLNDPSFPPCLPMLAPCSTPFVVEGRLLAPDEAPALLHLEALVATGFFGAKPPELISAQCWPLRLAGKLRRYLLGREACWPPAPGGGCATSSMPVNAGCEWFERPIQLYESRRLIYRLERGRSSPLLPDEPATRNAPTGLAAAGRSPWRSESRDCPRPQLQALLRRLGQICLWWCSTQVVGRAIGLVRPRHFCRAWAAAFSKALNDSRPWLLAGLRRPSGGEAPGRASTMAFPSPLVARVARAPWVCLLSASWLGQADGPALGLPVCCCSLLAAARSGRGRHSRTQQLDGNILRPLCRQTAPLVPPRSSLSSAG